MQPSQRRLLVLVACVAFVVTACGSSSPSSKTSSSRPPGKYESLIDQAKKEGKVTFQVQSSITMGDAQVAKAMSQGLKDFYGIDINVSVDSSLSYNAAMAKTIVEVNSNAPTTYDLLYQDTITSLPGLQAGIIQKIDWKQFPWINDKSLAYDGLVPIPAVVFNLPAYNTNLVKGADVPTSWNDLLKPQWRGKIGTTSYPDPWLPAAMPQAMGESALMQYARGLAALNPVLGRFGDLHQKLISGNLAIFALDNVDWVQHDQAKGAPIALANLQPVLVVTKVLDIPRGAPHSAAAQLLAGWLLSPDGQKFMDEAYTSSPYIQGTKSSEFLANKQSVSPSEAFLTNDATRVGNELGKILVTK